MRAFSPEIRCKMMIRRMIRQEAIDLAKGKGDEGSKAIALAIVYLADVLDRRR